jgi:predicted transcriptional regulator
MASDFMAKIGRIDPAVPIEQSVFHDRLICLECAMPFKMLKRHLLSEHGLSITAYRQRFGLSEDYPTVAPGYVASRAALAKNFATARTDNAAQSSMLRKLHRL